MQKQRSNNFNNEGERGSGLVPNAMRYPITKRKINEELMSAGNGYAGSNTETKRSINEELITHSSGERIKIEEKGAFYWILLALGVLLFVGGILLMGYILLF